MITNGNTPHSAPKRVRYTEVLLPPNVPPEYADRQTLWNAVDAAERSTKAQTARRFTITLPRELTFEQDLALIRDYCAKQFVDKGMICDLYYHDSGNGNPPSAYPPQRAVQTVARPCFLPA